MRAHALLAGTEKVVGEQPLAQGNMAIRKDRANGHGELFATPGDFQRLLRTCLSFLDGLGIRR